MEGCVFQDPYPKNRPDKRWLLELKEYFEQVASELNKTRSSQRSPLPVMVWNALKRSNIRSIFQLQEFVEGKSKIRIYRIGERGKEFLRQVLEARRKGSP